MFWNKKYFPIAYGKGAFSTMTIAKTVFGDIERQEAVTKPSQISEHMLKGHVNTFIEQCEDDLYRDMPRREKFESVEEYDKARAEWDKREKNFWDIYRKEVHDIAKEYLKSNSDGVTYLFGYSDNDGRYFSTLEHGGIFDRLPNITVSCH